MERESWKTGGQAEGQTCRKDTDSGEIALDGENETETAEKRNDSPANRKSNSISSAVPFCACARGGLAHVSLTPVQHRARRSRCLRQTNIKVCLIGRQTCKINTTLRSRPSPDAHSCLTHYSRRHFDKTLKRPVEEEEDFQMVQLCR